MNNNNGTAHCTKCALKMHRNGTTKQGKVRLRCPKCGTSVTLDGRVKRPDTRLRNMLAGITTLLTSKWTFSEYGRRKGVSRRTISRNLRECIERLDVGPPEPTGEVYDCLIVDATWLSDGTVAIARTPEHVQQWVISNSHEGIAIWTAVFQKITKPRCIVCDGHKSLIAAAKNVYGNDVMIQRCHFHLYNTMRSYLPASGKDPVARQLWSLFLSIKSIRTQSDARAFERRFKQLYDQHRQYVDEHTMMTTPTNQVMPLYTHNKLHAAYALLERLINERQLFNYVDHPELSIPSTTNLLEGGINSRIAELLKCHRGLTMKGQAWVINLYLWTKTEFGKPTLRLREQPMYLQPRANQKVNKP